MAPDMKAHSKMICAMVKELSNTRMVTLTLEIGFVIESTAMELTVIQMEFNTRVNGKMVKKMALAGTIGQMAPGTKVNILKVNNMERES